MLKQQLNEHSTLKQYDLSQLIMTLQLNKFLHLQI